MNLREMGASLLPRNCTILAVDLVWVLGVLDYDSGLTAEVLWSGGEQSQSSE